MLNLPASPLQNPDTQAALVSSAVTPAWVRDAIFYQIFPDRFAMSDSVEKPHYLESWNSPPTTYGFKGGDLMGIVEHLDYLLDLGINAIYFTPIFQSTANHRYHTYDYFQVDPILGGNPAFRAFLKAAHAHGIRVVLDGVFNHASRGFYQFNHTLENGRASPYLDWFTFNGFPPNAYEGTPNYECWWDLAALPQFNHSNPQVREYIYRVAEHWVQEGIDGWRLDVPGEIDDDEFWREFRRRVKAVNPDAYIVGEIWHKAARWLTGDQFDAVMNYQFTRACLSFFIDPNSDIPLLTQGHSYGQVKPIEAAAFANEIEEHLRWYPEAITYAQMNLLDSHDTARFLTIAQGDTSALKLALLTLLTYPGAPTIYYGDEIGLQGRKDPDCRRAMEWDESKWDPELHASAKSFIGLRNKYPALRHGRFVSLYTQKRTYAFARQSEQETVIVALNAGRTPVTLDLPVGAILPEGVRLVDEWSQTEISIPDDCARDILVPARGSRVLVAHL